MITNNAQSDFSRGSVAKHILQQAVPLTIAQLFQLLYNMVDRIYLGHLSGTEGAALTGVGIVFPLITIVAAFTNLLSMGGAPLFSISRGAGEEKKASRIMNNTFFLLCVMAVLLMFTGYLFKRPLLYLFGASETTYYYAESYLSIYLMGTIFVMIATGMNPFINAQGFPKMGMAVVISGALMNLALDPVFIFVFGLGVRGAALATVLSQFLTFILVLGFFVGKKTMFRLSMTDMLLQPALVLRILGLGLSGFIMAVTNSLVQIVCNRTLKVYGGDLYIAVMTVLNSVREIANVVVIGITNGAQPVIGYNYGAGRYMRVKRSITVMALLGIGYTALFWMAVFLFPKQFIRMFSDNNAILSSGVRAIHIYFFGFFFMAFQFVGQSTFVALGKSKYSIFFSLFRKVIIVIPLTVFLPQLWGMGTDGVFMAEPISNAIGGLACFITMLFVVGRELAHGPKEITKHKAVGGGT